MSAGIPFERPGFRTWAELQRDLKAIAAAPAPLNHVTLSFWQPTSGQTTLTGRLRASTDADTIDVMLDDVRAMRLTQQDFRGAWLASADDLSNDLSFVIDVDLGRGYRGPQIRGDTHA